MLFETAGGGGRIRTRIPLWVVLASLIATPAPATGAPHGDPGPRPPTAADTAGLSPFAYLVGGTWTSDDTLRLAEGPAFRPAVRYDWAVEGHLLRAESWRRALDGSVRPNNVGFYWWRAERRVVTHVLMFPDGGRIEGDYLEPERPGTITALSTYHPAMGQPSRWRSTIEQLDPDRIRETASRWTGVAWQTTAVLTFTRTR